MPCNEHGGRKPLDVKCQWLNQPAQTLLPRCREDAPSPLLWDSGCTGRHRPPAVNLDKVTGDQKAGFALYIFKRFVCSQLSPVGVFSAPTSTELETADSKGPRAGGSVLRVRVAARMTRLPTQLLGLPVITAAMAALPFHPLQRHPQQLCPADRAILLPSSPSCHRSHQRTGLRSAFVQQGARLRHALVLGVSLEQAAFPAKDRLYGQCDGCHPFGCPIQAPAPSGPKSSKNFHLGRRPTPTIPCRSGRLTTVSRMKKCHPSETGSSKWISDHSGPHCLGRAHQKEKKTTQFGCLS